MLTINAQKVAAATVFTSFTSLQLTAPKPVTEAHERFTRITKSYDARPSGQGEALALALIEALENGEDPAASAGVQRVQAAGMLDAHHGIADTMTSILLDQLRETVRANSDAVVSAWRPLFDAAAEATIEAHGVLGGIPLEDTGNIVRKGGAAAEAWGKAQSAVAAIDTIRNAWSNLYAFTMGATVARDCQLLTIAEVEPEDWLDRQFTGRSADPWAAITDGLALSLPTVGRFRGQVAAINELRQRRDEAGQAAEHAAERRSLGGIDPEFVQKVEQSRAAEAAAMTETSTR